MARRCARCSIRPTPFRKENAPRAPEPRPAGAECGFSHAAPRRYAVAVVHDEIGNGKLNRPAFIGVPREGYDLSNTKICGMHAPLFEQSAFTFDGTGEAIPEGSSRY